VKRLRAWFTPQRRLHIYDVANAGVAAGVVYGLATEQEAAALLLIVNAVLGLARANVDTAS
jgi:hypothetical protein